MAPRLIMDRLTAYLAETEGAPFVWGETDCCAWAAEWVRRLTGADPMARWRGRYVDAATARATMGPRGLPAAFLLGCRAAGLAPLDPPMPGCVGLIETAQGPAAAIRGGLHWVGKIDCGLSWVRDGRLAMGLH